MQSTPLGNLWSAAPTPLTQSMQVDVSSVERMTKRALKDGLSGMFLAGTCGEGMCLPVRECRRLVEAAVQAGESRIQIAVQVTDNSAARILENIESAAEAGADIGIIAPPASLINPTPERIFAILEETALRSALPLGLYDLGSTRANAIPETLLKAAYLLPNVQMVKDSSADPSRRDIALAARRERPTLRLFNGDEFRFVEYLEAGYDGCLFGGAVAVGALMREVAAHYEAGRLREAKHLEGQMKATLYGIYGGTSFDCWLTGLKYYLVRIGLFETAASFFGYPLSEDCRLFVERLAAEHGGLASGPRY